MGFERRDRGERFGGERRGFGGGRRFGGGRGGGGGFRRREENFGLPKPVKIGEEYDVKVTEVGAKGDGITKVKNFVVFVPGAQKDEEIRIRIKEVANRFAIAEKLGPAQGPVGEAQEEQSAEPADDSDSQESNAMDDSDTNDDETDEEE
jgi:predicted RNA-binding protein with TRAM domain